MASNIWQTLDDGAGVAVVVGTEDVDVKPDVPSTLSAVVAPDAYIEVGKMVQFYIISKDRFGNSIPVGGQTASFTIMVVGDVTGAAAATTTNTVVDRTGAPGSYSGQFTPNNEETYTLTVRVDGYDVLQGSSTHIALVFLANEAAYFRLTQGSAGILATTGSVGDSLQYSINQWNTRFNRLLSTSATKFRAVLTRPAPTSGTGTGVSINIPVAPDDVGAADINGNRALSVPGGDGDDSLTKTSGVYTLTVELADAATPTVYNDIDLSPTEFTLKPGAALASSMVVVIPDTPTDGTA